MFPIILNSSNVVAGTNNSVFRYSFPAGAKELKKKQIAVMSVALYYSWFNLTAANGNNTFQYRWPSGSTTSTYTVTVPDGYYSIDDLNALWQNQMVANGHYLVSDTGSYVYYLELTTNASKYAVQFNAYVLPTALPDGYSNPANVVFPSSAATPQIVVPSTNFASIVGFSAGTYPSAAQSTVYSKTSDFTPQVTPIQSLIMTCSLLNNPYSNPNTLLYTFTFESASFGGLISSTPNSPYFTDIAEGYYNQVTIQFLDQNLNPVSILDNNVAIMLAIQDAPK